MEVLFVFGENAPLVTRQFGLADDTSGVMVSLPGGRGFPPELDSAAGPWCTPAQVAKTLGRSTPAVRDLVLRGDLSATKVERGGREWLWVAEPELARYLSRTGRPTPVRLHFGRASTDMAGWLRDAMAVCRVGRMELARRAAVTPDSLYSLLVGRHATSKDVAVKVARALLALAPSPLGETLLAIELCEPSALAPRRPAAQCPKAA